MTRFTSWTARLVIVLAGLATAERAQAQAAKPAPTTPPAPLGDEAELSRVVTLYDAGKYAECADQLGQLLDAKGSRPLRDPQVVERARVYHAACLIGSGQRERAGEVLRTALRATPLMKPPNSLVFPQPVIDEFFRAQESMREEIRAAEARRLKQRQDAAKAQANREAAERGHLQELKRLASEETVLVKNRRAVALLPFGVGQFQNRDPVLGWVFLTAEAALAGTALTSLVVRAHLNEAGKRADADTTEGNQRIEDWQTALVISSYGFLTVAAAGIVEAQISFEPEFRETRRRRLPRHLDTLGPPSALRVEPTLAPLQGGAQLGLRGSF
jgi:hypothetical protein